MGPSHALIKCVKLCDYNKLGMDFIQSNQAGFFFFNKNLIAATRNGA